jgi:hypothetical protein
MDGNAGYNQIFMAVEDVAKTAFRCPRHIGLFEWIVMTFVFDVILVQIIFRIELTRLPR